MRRLVALLLVLGASSQARATPDAGPPGPCTFGKGVVDCEVQTIDDALAKTLAKHKSSRLRVSFVDKAKSADLASLGKVPWVSEVSIVGNDIGDLAELAQAPKLVTVIVRGHGVKDLTPLAKLPELATAMITGMGVTDVAPLATAPKLRFLSLPPLIKDVSALAKLAPLRSLTLSFDVKGLSTLTQLEELTLLRSAEKDTSAMASLTGLTKVSINRALFLLDVSGLAGMTKLRELELVDCPKLSSLAPLSKLSTLRSVDLTGTAVTDLSPLLGSGKTLEKLVAPENTPAAQLEPFKKLNPKLK